jgi:hypothetical protein
MAAKTQLSNVTIALSVLSASGGDAFYDWWRHGRIDWIGVAEFALGWGIAAVAIRWIGKLWQARTQRQDGRRLTHQE